MKTLAILLLLVFFAITPAILAQNANPPAESDQISLEEAVESNLQAVTNDRISANATIAITNDVENIKADVWLEPLQLAANIPTAQPSGMIAIPLSFAAKGSVFTYGTEACEGEVAPLESADLDQLRQDPRFKIASSFVWVPSTDVPGMVRDGTVIPLTADQAANPEETLVQLAQADRPIVTLAPKESALASTK